MSSFIKKSSLLIILIIFIFLYSTYQLKADDTMAINRYDTLLNALVQTEQSIQSMGNEINTLKNQLQYYKKNSNVDALIKDEKEKADILAGLTDVQGPGIIITLNDSKTSNQVADKQNYIVHDIYIQQIVNILKTAGAEAISVNDQRIVDTSEILCVGPTITVNKVDLIPPYTIKAIGNSDVMLSSLNLDIFPYLESLKKEYGLVFNYQKNESIYIQKYSHKR